MAEIYQGPVTTAKSFPWASRLNAPGVRHVSWETPAQEMCDHKAPTLYVFWHDGRPVGQQIAEPDTMPPPLSADAIQALSTSIDAEDLPSVSLIICTRDRPEALERCLNSLSKQRLQPAEIIVVDNASATSATQEVCRKAAVRYVREDRPGLDYARNTGARAANGEILAYTDDDVIVHPEWLYRLTIAFDGEEVWATTGLVLPAELATAAQWHFEKFWGFGRGFKRRDFGPDFVEVGPASVWEIGAGANMAFRREVFDRAGYFDERLDVGAAGCSGDSEFWYRILSAGGTCRYEPAAVVFHYHRREWNALKRQIHDYMSGHAAALLVQFERTGRWANLRRLLLTLPRYFANSLLRRFVMSAREEEALRLTEVAGLLSGIRFYFRERRKKISP